MRFGCCVELDKIAAVQDAGYDFVELPVGAVKPEVSDAEFEPVLEEIAEYEIVPEVWNRFLPDDMKVTGPEVDSCRIEGYLRTAFERIEELGGEIVVFGSGPARRVPEGFPMDEAREQLIEFVTLAGKIAGTHGLTIAVEPQNSKISNIITTIPEALEIVRAVDHPFVKLIADLYHMDEEGEPVAHIMAAGEELVHVHTADTGRRYPGSGAYPHKELFEALAAIGYDERVSVECLWTDFDAECRKALDFLSRIIHEER